MNVVVGSTRASLTLKKHAPTSCEVGARSAFARKPSSVPRSSRPLAAAIIPLGRALPVASSSLPAGSGESPSTRALSCPPHRLPMRPCSRWGLPCHPRYRGRGGLLPRRFTLTRVGPVDASGPAVCSLWHSPRALPSPGVTRHRTLWSSDFPPVAKQPAITCRTPTRRTRPELSV